MKFFSLKCGRKPVIKVFLYQTSLTEDKLKRTKILGSMLVYAIFLFSEKIGDVIACEYIDGYTHTLSNLAQGQK